MKHCSLLVFVLFVILSSCNKKKINDAQPILTPVYIDTTALLTAHKWDMYAIWDDKNKNGIEESGEILPAALSRVVYAMHIDQTIVDSFYNGSGIHEGTWAYAGGSKLYYNRIWDVYTEHFRIMLLSDSLLTVFNEGAETEWRYRRR